MDGGEQLGMRKHRGLLVAGKPSDTRPIRVHADINGAYNIMRRYYMIKRYYYKKERRNGENPSEPIDFFGIFRETFSDTTHISTGKTMKKWQQLLLKPPQIIDLDSKNPKYNENWSWQRPDKSFPPQVNPYELNVRFQHRNNITANA